LSLELADGSRITFSDDQVIHVDAHDEALCAVAADVHTVLIDTALEAKAEKGGVELLVPDSVIYLCYMMNVLLTFVVRRSYVIVLL